MAFAVGTPRRPASRPGEVPRVGGGAERTWGAERDHSHPEEKQRRGAAGWFGVFFCDFLEGFFFFFFCGSIFWQFFSGDFSIRSGVRMKMWMCGR